MLPDVEDAVDMCIYMLLELLYMLPNVKDVVDMCIYMFPGVKYLQEKMAAKS